jgi:adenylate cyclase
MSGSKGKGDARVPPARKAPPTRLGRLLLEVRRRRIIETLAAFIGGGWLLLEFVHWILIDHYHLPESLLDVVFVTLLGALLSTLAWRWFRGGARGPRKVKAEAVLIPLFVVATAVMDVRLFSRKGGPDPAAPLSSAWLNSIAVMPFADLSRAADQAYFCEGMAEDIRTKLTRLGPRLKVIARYAMLPYKEARKPVADVARELDVATILEGSVQKEGDRIRVNAQLINAASGAHIWADLYDRTVENVFDVQEEISLAIVSSLELELAPGAADAMREARPRSLEAYDYFLRGESITISDYALTSHREDFDRALGMFRKAIELDPTYARAYAGLAWAYNHLYMFSGEPEHAALVMEYVKKAFDLDPDLPEGQAGEGYYLLMMGDPDGAFKHLRRALALSPNMMEILHVIGIAYNRTGLNHQAIKFYRKALDLSPGYLFAMGNLGSNCLVLGDLECAEAYFRKVMAVFPDHPNYICDQADLLIRKGKLDEAEAALNRAGAINLGVYRTALNKYRGLLAAARGRKDEALALDRSPDVYALLGMKDEAIEALRRVDRRDYSGPRYEYLNLVHDAHLDPLRGDTRFRAILAERKAEYDERVKKYGDL